MCQGFSLGQEELPRANGNPAHQWMGGLGEGAIREIWGLELRLDSEL